MLAVGKPRAVELADQFANNKNARLRARALWLLATSSQGQKYVQDALKDQDVDIRITGIRAARLGSRSPGS